MQKGEVMRHGWEPKEREELTKGFIHTIKCMFRFCYERLGPSLSPQHKISEMDKKALKLGTFFIGLKGSKEHRAQPFMANSLKLTLLARLVLRARVSETNRLPF